MTATLPAWLWLVLCVGSCIIGFGTGMLVVWPHRYPVRRGLPDPPVPRVSAGSLPIAGRFPADTGGLILWSDEYAKFDRIDSEIASWNKRGEIPARWRDQRR